jgi:GNAT superfamily N-acetyltransferase
LIGQRIVVRRILRGQLGPTGGPAFTDLLGVMESWSAGVTTVRSGSGELTAIAINDIVSGKPVPERPSVRHRVSPEEAERRAIASWPALVSEALGGWLLRASDGFSSRANSVLAVGDPGVPFDRAVERVLAFYDSQRLPAWAQVVVGSDVHRSFEDAGWVAARPGEADTMFQLASVSKSLRAVRRSSPSVVPPVSIGTTANAAWLADDARALSHREAALGVLEGPDEVGFAAVERDGQVIAKGRVAYHDEWIGISDIAVSPEHRRQGLARVVMGSLLEWGAERGATTAYLQTRGDNPAALALYESMAFATHHAYRYLTPSSSRAV